MADPATIALVATVASTVVSGTAAFASAQANANIADYNAEINEQNAKRAIDRAQVEQEEQDLAAAGFLGEQTAAIAAGGVDVGTGSALRSRVAAKELARKDALNIRQAGEIEAYNYQADAASQRAQADGYRAQGMFSALGAFLEAGTFAGGAQKTKKQTFQPVPRPRPASLLGY